MDKEDRKMDEEEKKVNREVQDAKVKKEDKTLKNSKEKKEQVNDKIENTNKERKGGGKQFAKKERNEVVKKEEAVARGLGVHMSKKQGVYICRFIKNKKIDDAIYDLNEVIKMKKAVPFKGEIPHRKGKGMMSGRYPVKAARFFIKALKGLRGNVLVNGMDLDRTVIYFASASWASRPAKRGGRQAKRTNLIIKAREKENKNG